MFEPSMNCSHIQPGFFKEVDFYGRHLESHHVQPKTDITEMSKYKYLLSVEGNDVATGLKWMLYSNSVVLMSPQTQATWAMEDLLLPFVHYLPLEHDYSNLLEMLEWAEQHQEACQEISKRATDYIERLWLSKQAQIDYDILRTRLATAYVNQFQQQLSQCDSSSEVKQEMVVKQEEDTNRGKLPTPTEQNQKTPKEENVKEAAAEVEEKERIRMEKETAEAKVKEEKAAAEKEKKTADKEKIELAKIIEKAKTTCETLGFEKGTDKFSDCTLKLYTQEVDNKVAIEVAKQKSSSGSSNSGTMVIYDPVRDRQNKIDKGMEMITGRCTLGTDC